ncbi:MAG: hypothetical protein KF887_10030 [Paracoccaceae bacterium]|nr:MAG: hypothetical protein KF887_10030 [Paracoccaceae bacterium]
MRAAAERMAQGMAIGYEHGRNALQTGQPMSNRAALVLGLVIVAAAVADQVANGGTATLFLGRKLVSLIEYAAFWR